MPTFVPVTDLEKPRVAQDSSSKHSNFNKSVQPTSSYYGNKDNGGSGGSSNGGGMIKNEMGLWVKVKVDKRQDNNKRQKVKQIDEIDSRRRSRSRDNRHGSRRSRSRERHHDSRRRSRSRDKDRHGSRRSRSRERHHDSRRRSRSRDKDRHGSRRSRSRERHHDSRRSRSRDKYRHGSRRSRSKSRDRHREVKRSRSRSQDQKDQMKSDANRQLEAKNNTYEDEEESMFRFNATQVINRFLEVYVIQKETKRIEELETLFAEDASIYTLKTRNVLLNGRSNIVNSFINTNKCVPNCTRRVFIEIDRSISYSYDLYPIGQSPGLGNPEKSSIVLYRVQNNVITSIYGMPDPDNLSSQKTISSENIYISSGWKLATDTIKSIDSIDINTKNAYFHDYTNVEVWG